MTRRKVNFTFDFTFFYDGILKFLEKTSAVAAFIHLSYFFKLPLFILYPDFYIVVKI